MGSGDRIKVGVATQFGVGIWVSRFPFAFTLDLLIGVFYISIGFGKGYDQ